MKRIGEFVETCAALTADQFRQQQAPLVFVHSSLHGGPVRALSGVRAKTLDSLVMEEQLPEPAKSAPRDVLTVFGARPSSPSPKRFSVGCDASCDVRINVASISGVHSYVHDNAGAYSFEDAGSTLGSWVNGTAVEGSTRRRLESGDRVAFGSVDLLFLSPRDFHALVRHLAALGF